MEYYNNILCIPAQDYYHEYSSGPGKGEVVEEHCVTYAAYLKQVDRGCIKRVREGKGEGNYALIALDSIPERYRKRFTEGDTIDMAKHQAWIDNIKKDYQAVEFFMNYRYPDGSTIATDRIDNIKLWSNNASILNAIGEGLKSHTAMRARLGKRPLKGIFFKNMASVVESKEMQSALENNLPTNAIRLQKKYEEYARVGYYSLIKQLKGNANATKINDKLLHLFETIATLPTRPYNTKVVELYEKFMAGEREMIDGVSGEVFDPMDYLDGEGNIIKVTESAVWQRLSNPAKQAVLDKKRLGAKDYNDTHRPHRHRHSPVFSFSKISLDDRDLIWKDKLTKKRVKAYYAYDVASGCRIGSAYSMDKNEELFLDCLRDMFVFIDRHGFGVPMEVEVENHLVNKFFDDLAVMFPYLRVCAPGNSQEKRAEHFNRYVKYSVEKNNHPGVGRWWLKSRYNRVSVDKIDDQFRQTMKDVDRMIADDIIDTLEYNNSLHPNKKLYPGKTRMQVLAENINPNLPALNKAVMYRYIGFETPETSIVRNMYISANNSKYMLPHPSVLERLAPNNRVVQAYWMPDDDGVVNEIYVYQNGHYLCTCEKLETYNEAQAERTQADWDAKAKQDKYVAMFDAYIKEGTAGLAKLEVVSAKNYNTDPEPEVVPDVRQPERDINKQSINYSQKAIDDFYN